jgi:5-formyltetrahydrofolate cyclo-ligase
MKTKSELRRHYLSVLSDLDHRTSIEERELYFNISLSQFFESRQGIWAAFQPLRTEPFILKALSSIKNVQFCFPKIQGETLEFVMSSQFQRNQLGFLEPVGGHSVGLLDIQGVLVPGLAFDRQGTRLGRGRAFYDKTLGRFKLIKAAVCYELQLHNENLPAEDHDVPMDFIITEKEIISARKERN